VDYLISWVWSFFAGVLSVSFLLIAWGAIPATVFAIIGVFRGRCPKYAIFMYAALIPICTFLFKAVFWISDRIMQPDNVSTTIFWSSVFISAVGALFIEAPRLMKEVWRLTNGSKKVADLMRLTGNEWLSWPLSKKQALLADHLTSALISIGSEKKFTAEEVSLEYIKGIDETAEKHPDDPRLNKFIENMIKAMMSRSKEEFEKGIRAQAVEK
jgi:hypothetical protein